MVNGMLYLIWSFLGASLSVTRYNKFGSVSTRCTTRASRPWGDRRFA
jgi:hypothetical protein